MKKIICLISLITIFALPILVSAIEESDLPQEKASPLVALQREAKPSVTIQGYANSKNVILIGGVMGVTYNFCNRPSKRFCSDQQGILILGGSDTGKIPSMVKTLDKALEENAKVVVKFSADDHFLGASEILDVKSVNSAI